MAVKASVARKERILNRSSGIYPDEHIDFWGDVYLALGLRELGVEFERFLEEPAAQLERLGIKPLAPAQEEAAADFNRKGERC